MIVRRQAVNAGDSATDEGGCYQKGTLAALIKDASRDRTPSTSPSSSLASPSPPNSDDDESSSSDGEGSIKNLGSDGEMSGLSLAMMNDEARCSRGALDKDVAVHELTHAQSDLQQVSQHGYTHDDLLLSLPLASSATRDAFHNSPLLHTDGTNGVDDPCKLHDALVAGPHPQQTVDSDSSHAHDGHGLLSHLDLLPLENTFLDVLPASPFLDRPLHRASFGISERREESILANVLAQKTGARENLVRDTESSRAAIALHRRCASPQRPQLKMIKSIESNLLGVSPRTTEDKDLLLDFKSFGESLGC